MNTDIKEDDFELWEENLSALKVFSYCLTQWRISAGGIIGLDYNAVFSIMSLLGIKKSERQSILSDIMVIEGCLLKKQDKGAK